MEVLFSSSLRRYDQDRMERHRVFNRNGSEKEVEFRAYAVLSAATACDTVIFSA
jgi:hypothetical protein